MATTVAVVVVVGLLVSLGVGLLLYWGVRAEARRREPMKRRDAERVARRDTDDPVRDE